MSGKLRLGVIGLGAIGLRHAALIAADPECRLVATADPATTLPGIAPFPDWAAMLAAVPLDGAIIATPNALHEPAALACIARGVPVLVEKPIADSIAAARRICAAAASAGVPLLVGHHRRHAPRITRAREVIAAGTLGRLVSVVSLWLVHKPDAYFTVPWRRAPGAGPVLINFIHDVDLLRHLCGEIDSVQAATADAARGLPVEDSAAAVLRFTGGALGSVAISDAVAAPWSWEMSSGENPDYPRADADCYLLAGTEASLALPNLTLWRHDGTPGWNTPLVRSLPQVAPGDPLELQLHHFRRVIRGEAAPLVSGPDAMRSLAAALALHEAARSGRAVAVAEMLEE